ncbi:hypothetical protein TWF696_003678 [Orbilia brochopaga]|uniref:Uncharacterized protein n=1 Tax=Orbilia brochopaga TaxID=3140254 RepID=A0AAV9V672_9PEZI
MVLSDYLIRVSVTDAAGRVRNHPDPSKGYPLTVQMRYRKGKLKFIRPSKARKLPEMLLVDGAIMRMIPNHGAGRCNPFRFEGKSYPRMGPRDPFTELHWHPGPQNRYPTAHHIFMRFGVDSDVGAQISGLQKPGGNCPVMIRYLLHLTDLMVNSDDDADQHSHEFCSFQVPMPILWGLIMLRSFNRWWTVPDLMDGGWCWDSGRPGHDGTPFKPVNETALYDDVYLKIWVCTPAERGLPAPGSCSFMLTHRGEAMESTDSSGFETEGEDLSSSQSSDFMTTSQPINITNSRYGRERGSSDAMPPRSSVSSSYRPDREPSHRQTRAPHGLGESQRAGGVENYRQGRYSQTAGSNSYVSPPQTYYTAPAAPFPFEEDAAGSFRSASYLDRRHDPRTRLDDAVQDSEHSSRQSIEDTYMERVLPKPYLYLDLTDEDLHDLKYNGTGIPLTPPVSASEATTSGPRWRRRRPREGSQHPEPPVEMSYSMQDRVPDDDYVRVQWERHYEQPEPRAEYSMDELSSIHAGSEFSPRSASQHDFSNLSSTPRQRRRHEGTGASYSQRYDNTVSSPGYDNTVSSPIDSRSPSSPLYSYGSSYRPFEFDRPSELSRSQEDAEFERINQFFASGGTRATEDAAGSPRYRSNDRPSRQPRGYPPRADERPEGRNARRPDDSRQDYSSSSHRASYWQ